jgi:hypothetical protein
LLTAAQTKYPRFLGLGAAQWKKNIGRMAEQLCSIGHGLTVVASGCGAGAAINSFNQEVIKRAAKLEGCESAGEFGLDPNFAAQEFA